MSIEKAENQIMPAITSIEDGAKSKLVQEAFIRPGAATGRQMFDKQKTASAALPDMELACADTSSFRGSGEPYPYPDQTGLSPLQSSRDAYKYQDGNIYKF